MRYCLMHFAIVGSPAGLCNSLAVLTVGDQGRQGVNIDALRAPCFDAQWRTRPPTIIHQRDPLQELQPICQVWDIYVLCRKPA